MCGSGDVTNAAGFLVGGPVGVGAAQPVNEGRKLRAEIRAEGERAQADRLAAEAGAAQRAASRIAAQRKAMRQNSLFTGAGSAGSATGTTGVGRQTLGV